MDKEKILCLFDVDGTLTPARQSVDPDMDQFLQNIRKKVMVGIVSGSDLPKLEEQLSSPLGSVLDRFPYVFPENGAAAFKNGALVRHESISDALGDHVLTRIINFCLRYIADLDIPKKRGTFIEYRKAQLNISPVGRNCSQAEREEFNAFDKEHKVREKFVQALQKEFTDVPLEFAIGGQISIDAYPVGWDKRYCLQFLEGEGFEEIHFFGDKVQPGGNDYHIYEDKRTIGHAVTDPKDTILQVSKLIFEHTE